MARKPPLEVTPLGSDPDPLGQADLPDGDLLGKIFDRQREARIAAAREDAAAQADGATYAPNVPVEAEAAHAHAPMPSPPLLISAGTGQDGEPGDGQESNLARLQESKPAGRRGRKEGQEPADAPAPRGPARRELAGRAEEMGKSALRDVASRLPVELDRWLERTAFEWEHAHGTRLSKQSLLRLAVQRLFIDTELRGSLPDLEE